MNERILLISYYICLVGFITQLVLIFLQLRTYHRTKHLSLLLLAVSSIIGALYIALMLAPRLVSAGPDLIIVIYSFAAILVTIESVVGVVAVSSLFRAFELASVKQTTDKEPNNL